MKYRIVERPIVDRINKTVRWYYTVEARVLYFFWLDLEEHFNTKDKAKEYIDMLKLENKKARIVHSE